MKENLKVQSFVGISLGGAKNDQTAVAVLDYYPKYEKIFLSQITTHFEAVEAHSADEVLFEKLQQIKNIKKVAWDTPLEVPKCMRCRLKCPGYEKCKEPEIHWLWRSYRRIRKQKKSFKIFAPYTDRCVDYFLAHDLEEPFALQPALGANLAPVWARSYFLRRRWKKKSIEFHPKVTLWRLGNWLKVSKSHLRFHRHAVDSDSSRAIFLKALMEQGCVFLYSQDRQLLVQNPRAFDAFLGGLTALLLDLDQCEKRPKDFPKKEPWIYFPKEEVRWPRFLSK